MSLTDDIRAGAERVARQAQARPHQRATRSSEYARTLPSEGPPAPDLDDADDETRAAFSLQLNAINFGSGWFPTLNKPDGLSGFRTMEAGLKRRGPWTSHELQHLTRHEIAETFGQDPEHPLMGHVRAPPQRAGRRDRRLVSRVRPRRHGAGARRRARPLAQLQRPLALPRRRDPVLQARADRRRRPRAARADGPAKASSSSRSSPTTSSPTCCGSTACSTFDPELVRRIDQEELIEHDSPEEVEIRACALHAVELLVHAHGDTTATAVDNVLWHRGAAPRYKAHPRHRARCTAY